MVVILSKSYGHTSDVNVVSYVRDYLLEQLQGKLGLRGAALADCGALLLFGINNPSVFKLHDAIAI
jgi:hypothetical protein